MSLPKTKLDAQELTKRLKAANAMKEEAEQDTRDLIVQLFKEAGFQTVGVTFDRHWVSVSASMFTREDIRSGKAFTEAKS